MILNPNIAVNGLSPFLNPESESYQGTCVADTGTYGVSTALYAAAASTAQGDFIYLENVSGKSYIVWLDIDAAGTAPVGPVSGQAEVALLTFPAGAAAVQADYFTIENQAGADFAVWLDIDANGTAPSGAVYTAATNKVEVDILSTDSAAEIAGKIKAAIELDGSWADVTIVDNSDGTLTFTQDNIGVTVDPVTYKEDDSDAGGIVAAVSTQGTDGPDFKIEVNILSTDEAAGIATKVAAALALSADFEDITVVDDEEGTLTFTQDLIGVNAAIASLKADESAEGSTTVATTTAGVASNYQSTSFTFSTDDNDYYVWFDVGGEGVDPTSSTEGIEISIDAKDSSSDIASAIATALTAKDDVSAVADLEKFFWNNVDTGNETDAANVDSPITISTRRQGQDGSYYPAMSPADISLNPSA